MDNTFGTGNKRKNNGPLPRFVLADESTAALDYETSIEVLTVLEEVIHGGTTMLMVTHNEEIAKMANRVIRMKGGVVAEIIANGLTQEDLETIAAWEMFFPEKHVSLLITTRMWII